MCHLGKKYISLIRQIGLPWGSDHKESACSGGSLCREDPLEKGMATHSRILAWRIPRTEEPGGLQYVGLQRVRHKGATNTFLFLNLIILQGPA